MISSELLLPSLVAASVAVVATGCHRRVPPHVAARLLVVTIVVVSAAVVPVTVVLALSFVMHLPLLGATVAWCRDALGLHHDVPVWLGLGALAVLIAGLVRARRVRRTWRRFHCARSDGLQIVDSPETFAYTMPGAGGHIVVSSGLVEQLPAEQVAVVVAHERAHAAFRHDRYVHVGELAAALVPPLRVLQRRLRFNLERWADEAAAQSACVERDVVARTVAAVALSGAATPATATGISALGVASRVDALLQPPTHRRARSWTALHVVGIAAAVAAVIVQAHHLEPVIRTLCAG